MMEESKPVLLLFAADNCSAYKGLSTLALRLLEGGKGLNKLGLS